MALLDGWAFCSAEMRERANPAGAESSAHDLSLGLGAVLGRAATSLRSIETHPCGRLVRPLLEGHHPASSSPLSFSGEREAPDSARGEREGERTGPMARLSFPALSLFLFFSQVWLALTLPKI